MIRGMNKIVIVTRKTALFDLVKRYNTVEQARFYVEHSVSANVRKDSEKKLGILLIKRAGHRPARYLVRNLERL